MWILLLPFVGRKGLGCRGLVDLFSTPHAGGVVSRVGSVGRRGGRGHRHRRGGQHSKRDLLLLLLLGLDLRLWEGDCGVEGEDSIKSPSGLGGKEEEKQLPLSHPACSIEVSLSWELMR